MIPRFSGERRSLAACAMPAVLASGCSAAPSEEKVKVTGSAVAVEGLPRIRDGGRLTMDGCCSLRAGGARVRPVQGVDSTAMRIDGPGYALTFVFGPFNVAEAEPGFRAAGSRTIDGVRLSGRRWTGEGAAPLYGSRLWSASVGGRTRANLTHSPWGLRLQGRCADRRGCDALERLVGSIRF